MKNVPTWRRYARLFGVDVRSDVDDELRFHLEEKTRDLIAKGLTPDAARAEAQRQFGDSAEVRQPLPDARRLAREDLASAATTGAAGRRTSATPLACCARRR